MNRCLPISTLLTFVTACPTIAQERLELRGRIIDSTGEPVTGAAASIATARPRRGVSPL